MFEFVTQNWVVVVTRGCVRAEEIFLFCSLQSREIRPGGFVDSIKISHISQELKQFGSISV